MGRRVACYLGEMKFKQDDINLLLPTWRDFTQDILDDMTKEGFTPCLRDTWRSFTEAEANAARGVGVAASMHCFGVASDVICGIYGWDTKNTVKFYKALGRRVEARGGLWGGRFTRVDKPHFQGVSIAMQAQIRKLGPGPESAAARDALVKKFLSRKR